MYKTIFYLYTTTFYLSKTTFCLSKTTFYLYSLESLCSQIGIRGKPKIVDLTPQQRTASKLTETRLNFSAVEEKDLHLFCFLKEYPGRTIVFANSIDCVWRLMRLLMLLKMTPLRLFADMQQKQRLKSLETFKGEKREVYYPGSLLVFRFVCPSVCLSVCLSVCMSLCLSVCPSVCLCVVCLFVCLCVCLSVCMSMCLSVCLLYGLSVFVCLSVCLCVVLCLLN